MSGNVAQFLLATIWLLVSMVAGVLANVLPRQHQRRSLMLTVNISSVAVFLYYWPRMREHLAPFDASYFLLMMMCAGLAVAAVLRPWWTRK